MPASIFPMDTIDFTLSNTGFLLTTPEPDNSYYQDFKILNRKLERKEITLAEYIEQSFSRGAVAITTPFRYLAKGNSNSASIGDTPVTVDGKLYDLLLDHPLVKAS